MNRVVRCCVLLGALVSVAAGPPPTPVEEHVHTFFGMSFDDPYYWMEAGGPRFDAWLTAQSAYTRATLDAIPGRAAVLDQLERLEGGQTWISGVFPAGGAWIYSAIRPEDATNKLFVRPASGGPARVIVDPARFDAGGQPARIDYWIAAPDGRHVAYGVSLGGGETGTLRVVDVATGTDLPEAIDRTRYARAGWLDGERFLYPRLPPPGPDGRQKLTGATVYLHVLGTDPSADVPVFGPDRLPGGARAPEAFFRGLASPRADVVIGFYDAGLGNSPETVFVADKAGLGPHTVWRRVAGVADDVRGVLAEGAFLYLRTAKGAPRQRIVRVPARHPDLAHADTVLPEGEAAISAMAAGQDALYVLRSLGGIGQIVRIPWDGQPETLTMPFEGAVIGLTANPMQQGAAIRLEGWTRSETVFAYDPAAQAFTDTGIAPPSQVGFDDIVLTQARAPASDGTMVPVSIVAPRDTKRDGSHPLLLYAYGAYGATLSPNFDVSRRAWFDRGGIYAVVHVRGSGGFGDEWHRAGQLAEKRNSITDFIAAARYLEHEGWASPGTLAAMGGSAGGIVIGGAIAREPKLFSAAIIEVGLLNMLRLEQIPIGAVNTAEFGSTETEEGVRLLSSIDAFQQLRRGVAYPGTLIATKRNDARVSPWMPAKFAARMQADTAGPRPVLLRVEDAGGHGVGNKSQAQAEMADYFSFLLWQAGHPGFQPK